MESNTLIMKRFLTLENFHLQEQSDLANNPGWARKKYIELFTKMPVSKGGQLSEIQETIDYFCTNLKIDKEQFQYECLVILSDFFQAGKYYNAIKSKEVSINQEQLDIGIRFEMEHTSDPLIAKRIALDHLVDCDTYYTLLQEIEEKCKKQEENA